MFQNVSHESFDNFKMPIVESSTACFLHGAPALVFFIKSGRWPRAGLFSFLVISGFISLFFFLAHFFQQSNPVLTMFAFLISEQGVDTSRFVQCNLHTPETGKSYSRARHQYSTVARPSRDFMNDVTDHAAWPKNCGLCQTSSRLLALTFCQICVADHTWNVEQCEVRDKFLREALLRNADRTNFCVWWRIASDYGRRQATKENWFDQSSENVLRVSKFLSRRRANARKFFGFKVWFVAHIFH